MELPKTLTVFYYGRPVELEFRKEAGNEMKTGSVLLTKVGAQLAPICGSRPDLEFYAYILTIWKQRGYLKEEHGQQT
jgi:hypothetical protein